MSASPHASPHVLDVDQDEFASAVVDRSHEVPVVVDFWAAWCGPCRTLGPALEAAVDARGGDVLLAKVDVDRNQALAQRYHVQGIPAVKAFRDGQVVAEFTGAVGPPRIEAFLDRVVPSEADRLVAQSRDAEDEEAAELLARALDLDPQHQAAALVLAERLVATDPSRAVELVAPHRPHPEAEAILTRADLARSGGDLEALAARVSADGEDGDGRVLLGRALAAEGRYDEAVEHLLAAVERGGDAREAAREQLVALFNVLGDDHELVRDARPRLARALF